MSGAGKGNEWKTLPDAWERITEESNEGHWFALSVIFKVDGTLREESGLIGLDLIEDELATILRDHARDEGTVSDISELRRPWVRVGGDQTAWPNESGSYET